MPVPPALHDVIEIDLATGGDSTANTDRRSGRRIDLLPMVHFDNLGIVLFGGQRCRHLLGKGEHQRDAG